MREEIKHISERILVLNVYITQAIVLAIACVLLWWQGNLRLSLWQIESNLIILYGFLIGIFVLLADIVLTVAFPRLMTDDSGINEKLFRRRPVWHIFVIVCVVAFCEEMLFRGAIQPLLGIFWTSVLFTLIHYRYFRQWMMMAFLFIISLLFGITTELTGSLMPATIAHFTIDFVLALLIRTGLFEQILYRETP